MRSVWPLVTAFALLGVTTGAAAERVLFIGNSFTYGAGSAVRFYRNHTVTDLNDEGVGGVPALFESFTEQAGLDYDVALETRGGTGLDFHLTEKRKLIDRRWDVVVAHGYSTLDADQPRSPAKLAATAKELADVLRARNPRVALYLMAPWARADQVYPAGGAWNRAMQTGVADANPYDGIEAGKLDLWTYDHYHASTHGYYLEALVIFGRLTGHDPRSLGLSECSAFELGLSRTEVRALQQVAFDELAAAGAVAHNAQPSTAQASPVRCDAR